MKPALRVAVLVTALALAGCSQHVSQSNSSTPGGPAPQGDSELTGVPPQPVDSMKAPRATLVALPGHPIPKQLPAQAPLAPRATAVNVPPAAMPVAQTSVQAPRPSSSTARPSSSSARASSYAARPMPTAPAATPTQVATTVPTAKPAPIPAPATSMPQPRVAAAAPAPTPAPSESESPAPLPAPTQPVPESAAPAINQAPLTTTEKMGGTPSEPLPADTAGTTPGEIGATSQNDIPDNSPVAVLQTSLGKIVIQFDDNAAPKTCKNFRQLIADGFYNNTVFHRVIPNFIIQGGDPKSKSSAADRDTFGLGSPGYTLPPEIGLQHNRGAVGMARLPDSMNPQRESNGSQFYICLAPCPSLDNQYTVFGHVIQGLDVAEKIASQPRDARDNPLHRIEMSVSLIPRDQAMASAATGTP